MTKVAPLRIYDQDSGIEFFEYILWNINQTYLTKQNGVMASRKELKFMSRIAFVFPGQGAQYTGMATRLSTRRFPVSREVFEKASKVSGLDVETLCFEENEILNITEYTQIAMLAAEIAILRAVEKSGITSSGKCRTEPWRIRCTRSIQSYDRGGCLCHSKKKRNPDAGGISDRRCNVSSSWNRCRTDREDLRRDRRNRIHCKL